LRTLKNRENLFEIYKNVNNSTTYANMIAQKYLLVLLAYYISNAIDKINSWTIVKTVEWSQIDGTLGADRGLGEKRAGSTSTQVCVLIASSLFINYQ
jgi:ribosome-binding ATPase YchF (GTP1/OBG family)